MWLESSSKKGNQFFGFSSFFIEEPTVTEGTFNSFPILRILERISIPRKYAVFMGVLIELNQFILKIDYRN